MIITLSTHHDHIDDILLPCARTQNISRGSSDDCADNAENVVVPCIVLGGEHATWSPPCGPWESPYEQNCDCLVVKVSGLLVRCEADYTSKLSLLASCSFGACPSLWLLTDLVGSVVHFSPQDLSLLIQYSHQSILLKVFWYNHLGHLSGRCNLSGTSIFFCLV